MVVRSKYNQNYLNNNLNSLYIVARSKDCAINCYQFKFY